jgi:hypothetical protein
MMESLSQTDVKTDLPGGPGSLDDRWYSAMHNKVKNNLCDAQNDQTGTKYPEPAQGLLNVLETQAT